MGFDLLSVKTINFIQDGCLRSKAIYILHKMVPLFWFWHFVFKFILKHALKEKLMVVFFFSKTNYLSSNGRWPCCSVVKSNEYSEYCVRSVARISLNGPTHVTFGENFISYCGNHFELILVCLSRVHNFWFCVSILYRTRNFHIIGAILFRFVLYNLWGCLGNPIERRNIQLKATEQYFPAVLFITFYKMDLVFPSIL